MMRSAKSSEQLHSSYPKVCSTSWMTGAAWTAASTIREGRALATTITHLQEMVPHLRKHGEAPSLHSGWLRLFTASGGRLRPICAQVSRRHRRRCPQRLRGR